MINTQIKIIKSIFYIKAIIKNKDIIQKEELKLLIVFK